MPTSWFGSWTSPFNKSSLHLNDNYDVEMRSLIEHLNLVGMNGEPASQAKGKPKKGKDVIQIGRRLQVFIKKLVHTEFKRTVDGYTPVLDFDIVVMSEKLEGGSRRGESKMEVAYNGKLLVTYHSDYPASYPIFKLPKYSNFTVIASHDHHMYSGGKMCLYSEVSWSDSAWNPRRDTAAKAFTQQAIKWIAWHELWRPKYGVDANDVNRYY